MALGPGNNDNSTGPTGIVAELTVIINTEDAPWDQPTITFDQVVDAWNKIKPDQAVLDGLPSIEWNLPGGPTEIMYQRDDPVPVVDQMEFRIDSDYLS